MRPEDIIEYINSSEIKNIIVDCDAGADGDDQFALAYALTSPDRVNVLSVNSAPFNDNSLEMSIAGRKECLEIIYAAGLNVPVFCGSSDFIARHGSPLESDAANNIRDTVMNSEVPVFVVISGCCTNVASALALYPEIRDKLIVIWLALDNLKGDTNTGEYNYHNDIEGGKLLFSLAKNIVLVCAGRVVAPYRKTNDEIDELFNANNTLCSWLRRRFRELTWAQGLWDLCAEGVLIKPESCEMEISDRPVFGSDEEIDHFDSNSKIIVVNKNDPSAIISDCARRINYWHPAHTMV